MPAQRSATKTTTSDELIDRIKALCNDKNMPEVEYIDTKARIHDAFEQLSTQKEKKKVCKFLNEKKNKKYSDCISLNC